MGRIHNKLLKKAILHIALNVEGLWKGCGEESSKVGMLRLIAFVPMF
jgi:hypothetical protein